MACNIGNSRKDDGYINSGNELILDNQKIQYGELDERYGGGGFEVCMSTIATVSCSKNSTAVCFPAKILRGEGVIFPLYFILLQAIFGVFELLWLDFFLVEQTVVEFFKNFSGNSTHSSSRLGLLAKHHISENSFPENYSFLNLEIVENSNSCRKFKFFT